MSDYENLKAFWDKAFIYNKEDIGKDEQIWIEDSSLISFFKEKINKDTTILDYGSGSGWLLTQIALISPFKNAIGIDTSINGVNLANDIAKASGYNNIEYICGNEEILTKYPKYFDFIASINVLDVVPDEIIDSILKNLQYSLKDGGTVLIGLNPDFNEDQLINMIKMEKKGNSFYKDGILRANKKSVEEWEKLLSKYFKIVKETRISLIAREKDFPRVAFVITNK